jgi:predicted ArsR family transcriptional regulator
MTQKQKEGIFIANLNKAKLLPYFCTFNKIKYLGVDTFDEVQYTNAKGQIKFRPLIADFSGGFLKKTNCKSAAAQLNIHYTTFRRHIDKLVELGWMEKTFTGYRLVGKSVLFEKYGNGIKRLSLASETRQEVINEVAYNLIKANIKQQAYKVKQTDKTGRKYSNALVNTPECSNSIRWLQKQLGYKSPMSAYRVQAELEATNKIIIERRSQYVCHESEFPNVCRYNPNLAERCFFKGHDVYERLCNNIIISFKTEEQKALMELKKKSKEKVNLILEKVELSRILMN